MHSPAGQHALLNVFSHSWNHFLVTTNPLQETTLQTQSFCSSPLFSPLNFSIRFHLLHQSSSFSPLLLPLPRSHPCLTYPISAVRSLPLSLFLQLTSSSESKWRFVYCGTLAEVYAKCAEEEEKRWRGHCQTEKCVSSMWKDACVFVWVHLCAVPCFSFLHLSLQPWCPNPPLMCCPIRQWLSYRCIISCRLCLAQDQ